MAGSNYHAHPYVEALNEYHCELLACAQVTAHLLDLIVDMNVEEWKKSAAWMMRDNLHRLSEELPFPPLDLDFQRGGENEQA